MPAHCMPSELAFLWAYRWAHLGKSLTWYFSELLFAFFLTEICGLAPLAMGAALAASLAFSAVVETLVGKVWASRLTSVRSACSLQIPGSLGTGVTLVAFAATALTPAHVRLIYAIGCSCLFRVAFVFHDMPQNCIPALVRASDNARIRLSATRVMYSGIASVVVAATTAFLVGLDRVHGQMSFLLVSLLLAVIGSAGALLLGRATTQLNDAAPILPSTSGDPGNEQTGTFRALLWLAFIVAGSTGVFGRLESYFAAKALSDNTARIAVLVSIALGMIALQPAWAWLLGKLGPRGAFRAGAATLSAGCVLFFYAQRNVGALALAGMIYGCGLGGLTLVLWAAVAQLAAGTAARPGTVVPALGFALLTASSRVAAAVSILGVGLWLERIDYGSPVVAASWQLLAPMTGAPLVGGLVCLIWAGALPSRHGHSGPLQGAASSSVRM